MTRRLQIYYNAAFGALGALTGWFLIGLWPPGQRGDYFAEAVLVGASIGLATGGLIGMVDGAVIKRSGRSAVRGFAWGALAGFIGGGIGLGIGSWLFNLTQGGFVGRGLGFVSFGLLLGAGSGLADRALKRASYGLIGGALAGLLGGLVYEAVTQAAFRVLGETDATQTLFGALGMVVVGAALGGITRATEDAISGVVDRGLLIVRSGPKAGQEKRVGDPVIIGSYDGCSLYLPGDPGILKRHARVARRGRAFALEPLEGALVAVNGQAVPPGGSQPLRDHDLIRLGETSVEFLAR